MSKVILLTLALCTGPVAATTCAGFVAQSPCAFPFGAADASKSDNTIDTSDGPAANQEACCSLITGQTCKDINCDTYQTQNLKVVYRPDSDKVACNTDATVLCNPTLCCEVQASIQEGTPTTTFTPWDSSASSSDTDSSDSLYSDSSIKSNGVDVWNSVESSGSNASGSSGSYMPIWLWSLLACLLCACLGAVLPLLMKKKKKPTPKPKPQPPVVEEEILLPPLVPFEAPVTTAYAPVTTSYVAPQQMAYAAPMTYAQPMQAAYAPMAGTAGYVV